MYICQFTQDLRIATMPRAEKEAIPLVCCTNPYSYKGSRLVLRRSCHAPVSEFVPPMVAFQAINQNETVAGTDTVALT